MHSDYQSVVRVNKRGDEHLISLDDALSMCADPAWMGTLYGGEALKLTPSQNNSIRRLKKTLRNNLEHYVPRGWSIKKYTASLKFHWMCWTSSDF